MIDRTRAEDQKRGYGSRFEGFPDLMVHRVRDILLVSSLYDSFILAEDGKLSEAILSEYLDLNLRYAPGLTRVSSGSEALRVVREHARFNLVITSLQVGDTHAVDLARDLRANGVDVPVVLLAYDNRQLTEFQARHDTSDLDGVFLWSGDVRILLAVIKLIEDKMNLEHDVGRVGVPAILVVEDNVRFYSSFLPVIYTELMNHAQGLLPDGLNLSHKLMRIRARPKILLATSFEQAWSLIESHGRNILGVISDIEFPHDGEVDRSAGVRLAEAVRSFQPDIPVMLQSSRTENEALAERVGAAFLLKGSPLLLQQLREFLNDGFGFGDFVFRTSDGREVGRAHNLRSLASELRRIPKESLSYHASSNHFSRWLKLRTEFQLAERIRPERVSDFPDIEAVREHLCQSIEAYRRERHRGVVADFDPDTYDATIPFAMLGSGSLGGKARGLAFVNFLLSDAGVSTRFPDVDISVPTTVVLGTDIYDRFLDENDLRDFAIRCDDDDEIRRRIEAAPFPDDVVEGIRAFLHAARFPLAVRSSSLLEDSASQPFAGIYETFMLPNVHRSADERLAQLVRAIKRVYLSTFSSQAKAYLRATPYRLEEEKMAVMLQEVIGRRHGDLFYPDFAGVCRSHNFYPTPPLKSEDGVAAVALGLGRTVVEGDRSLRFSPRYPQHIMQHATLDDVLENSQRDFWALRMPAPDRADDVQPEMRLERFGLERAESDGTLRAVGSTWSPENEAVFDGLSRAGVRLVTFAPILKHGLFPLPQMLRSLLRIGESGTSSPVELEFAVRLGRERGERSTFGFLQLRPLAISRELEELDFEHVDSASLVCRSDRVLGHGRIESVRDVVVIDSRRFDRSKTRDAAGEVAHFNNELSTAGRPYLLIGVGRWGSTDPWLGIPVSWDQISGARVIVEAGFKDLRVEPSQGTHFFQNLTSCDVGYFTVNDRQGVSFVDWDWLERRSALQSTANVRHLRFEVPLVIEMNGQTGEGVIRKPSDGTTS